MNSNDLTSTFSEETIKKACKALWDSETHLFIEKAGYPTDYESQPKTIKRDLRRKVRAVIGALVCA